MKNDRSDVIVIGAGLSGLTAAALLAKQGLKVRLLEQHYQPGGSCGAFRRDGVTFDQGTAMFFGFGYKGFNAHRFVMNELDEPIEVIKHDMLYCLVYDGIPIHFHADLKAFYKELEQIFDEKDIRQIKAFYRYIGRLYHKVIAGSSVCVAPSEIDKRTAMRLLLRHPIRQLRALSLLKKSAGEIMRRFINSEHVIEFFNKLTSTYCYTLVDETPGILAATMFMDNHYGGSYYPVGSSQQVPGKLEKAFEKFGGTVKYGIRAKQILFDGGKVCGVLADTPDGERKMEADAIVYSGTVWDLYGTLITPEDSNPEIREWAKNLIPTYPSVVLYCLVDAHIIPDGTLPIQMLADNPKAIDEKEITLYIFSLADPSVCPPGTHTVMAIGPSFRKWPSPQSKTYQSADYDTAKTEETERILATLEKHFPGFRAAVRYSTLATPTTIERYTMKPGGAVAGPKQSMGQDLLNRPHAATAWENLFMCGESTVMGTGSPAVTVSGISAANMVLRRLGKKEYCWHKGMIDRVREYSASEIGAVEEDACIQANALDDIRYIKLHDDAAACQWCEMAPCLNVCPYHLDIRGILRRIEMGNYTGAYRALFAGGSGTDLLTIPCVECKAPCMKACAKKGGEADPVQIKQVFTDLRDFMA